jgi:hypothetical protein
MSEQPDGGEDVDLCAVRVRVREVVASTLVAKGLDVADAELDEHVATVVRTAPGGLAGPGGTSPQEEANLVRICVNRVTGALAQRRRSEHHAGLPQAAEVLFSDHAVERYIARVKPGLQLPEGRSDLERLCATGQVSAQPPVWARAAREAGYYLILGGSVAFPLTAVGEGWLATTCLDAGVMSSHRSEDKRRQRSQDAARKYGRRRG